MYGTFPSISPTIEDRGTRYSGHSWRCEILLENDVFWTLTHKYASADRPSNTQIHQLHVDMDTVKRNCQEQRTIGIHCGKERHGLISMLKLWQKCIMILFSICHFPFVLNSDLQGPRYIWQFIFYSLITTSLKFLYTT